MKLTELKEMCNNLGLHPIPTRRINSEMKQDNFSATFHYVLLFMTIDTKLNFHLVFD